VVQGNVTVYPIGITMDAYRLMLSNARIPLAFYNTIIYTIFGTSINVLLTAISAYPLSKKSLFGRNFFIKMIIITMFFGGGLIPSYLLVVNLGLINTIWAIVLPAAISPFYLFMTITFFQTIPPELEESAKIDGASVYRTLFSIILPLSRAILAALVLFYSMIHYNNYFTPLIYLTDPKKHPLQVLLQKMVIQNSGMMEGFGNVALADYSIISLRYATIVISIIPVLILYPFIQKNFMKGVMIGALKG
jgi:putative aldouronate transport system permease protein